MSAPCAPSWFFFDPHECELVTGSLEAVARDNPEKGALLRVNLEIVAGAAEVVRKCPSISRASESAGGRAPFSGEALVDLLCRVPDYDLDLHIPTKAVLGQAFLIAKINFLKALGYALDASSANDALRDQIIEETGQSIYSKLAEELFVSIVTDPHGRADVKASAAQFLFRIWEDRLEIEIDDFAPVLESAWLARNKVRPVMGTLLGTHEVFQLFREARDDRFLDYFGSDDVPEEQLLAFEEFLFGLSHEEIGELRAYMLSHGADVVSLDQARALLGTPRKSWTPGHDGAQALYTSYKKRRVKALYRSLTKVPGPKKTAEEYVMAAFLQRGSVP